MLDVVVNQKIIRKQLSDIEHKLARQSYSYNQLNSLRSHLNQLIKHSFHDLQGKGNFKYPRTEGILDENVPLSISSTIEGVSILREGESHITCTELVIRAWDLGSNYGQEDAEWLLQRPEMIPAKLREFDLVFPGTIWEDPPHHPIIPVLCWENNQWNLHFAWLGCDVSYKDKVRLIKPQNS